MKILWLSNGPLANTGYGSQTRLFAPRIRDLGHQVEIVAFYGQEGHISEWDGMRVWPKGLKTYGTDVAIEVYRRGNFDLLISLIDAWVMPGEAFSAAGVRWAPWFPCDSEPLPDMIYEQVRHAEYPLVFSRRTEEMCRDRGLDPMYIPHGFNAKAFYPRGPVAIAKHRKEELRVPENAYLVGIVAANKGNNPIRKSWLEQLDAVGQFMQEDPLVHLYLHTHLGPQLGGVDIERAASRLGLDPERVRVCDQFKNTVGAYTDTEMGDIYSSLDVLLNVSTGEGFGVPILEAQACGTPVIAGGWTAMVDVAQASDVAGHIIPKGAAERFLLDNGTFQWRPHVKAILNALMGMRHHPNTQERRELSRDDVDCYEADKITDRNWRLALERVEDDIALRKSNGEEIEVVR